MVDFEIRITGERLEDGSGKVKWRHTAADGKEYGDHVEMEDFDEEWMEAVEQLAIQAGHVLFTMYFFKPEE